MRPIPSCMTRAYQQEEYRVFSAGSVYFERFFHTKEKQTTSHSRLGFTFFLIFLIKNPQFF